MATNLLDITTNYRRFVKNQVLTEVQLNGVVNYFDDQDRLSRVFLSGVGILCGFEVSYEATTNKIFINQGTAITTDGDLVKFYENTDDGNSIKSTPNTYEFFRSYDNSEAKYTPHFYDEDDTQFEIYELFTATQVSNSEILTEETTPLQELTNEFIAAEDIVLLLYLEEYEETQNLCVSLSCDNQGLTTNSNLKVLAVDKEVALKILANDSIGSQPNFTTTLLKTLPDLVSNRVLLKTNDFSDYETLKQEFTEYTFKNDIASNTLEAYKTLFSFVDLQNWSSVFEEKFKELFNYEASDIIPPDFQYRYDLLKDIIDTYNEIKSELITVSSSLTCLPDIGAFPKHIMLGTLTGNDNQKWRHDFYKSKVFTQHKFDVASLNANTTSQNSNTTEFIYDLENTVHILNVTTNTTQTKLVTLVKRSLQLLINYNANFTEIRITPSFQLGKLSKKAIPFYNNVGNHLIDLWDFDKTQINQQLKNTSYHTKYLDYKAPLTVTLDSDFYRIEGHQGKNYKEVIQTLQTIRKNFNLSFNVVALKLKANSEESNDFLHQYTEKYLARTNGVEHKAGVVPGGTFIVAYIDSEYDGYPYPYGYGYPYYYPNTFSLAGDFEENDIEEPIKITTPVIADFAIPYLCCDENVIDLSLPVNKICFGEDTLPLAFIAMPKGGYVEAEVPAGLNGGVTLNEYGEFVFDPKLVSKELHGTPIKFTINNFETNCVITVNEQPDFTFVITTIGLPNEKNQIQVTFTITENNDAGNQYQWDFGDGNELRSEKLTISHIYQLKGERLEAKVNLVGSNNGCSTSVSELVVLELPNVSLSLPEDKLCFNAKTPALLFTIAPRNGIVAAVVEDKLNGGVIVQDDTYFFDPNTVSEELYNKEIAFTVNGFPTDCKIIIAPKPIFSFDVATLGEPKDGFIAVTFVITQDEKYPAKEFVWNFGDGTTESTEKLEITHNYAIKDKMSFTVSLTGTNETCSDIFSQSILLETPEEVSLSLPITQLCFDESTLPIQFTVDPREGIVAGAAKELNSGVELQEEGYFFNPNNVSEELYGKDIDFTVNGLATDCSIIIFPKPNFTFEIVNKKEGDGIVEITFEVNQNPILENTEFTWSFGDDSEVLITEDREVTHQYRNLGELELEEVEVKVKAVAGECSTTYSEIIPFFTTSKSNCLSAIEDYNTVFGNEYSELSKSKENLSSRTIISLAGFYDSTINEMQQLQQALTNDETHQIDFELFLRSGTFSTMSTALNELETIEDNEVLSFLSEANTTLFYLLWCCISKQKDDTDTSGILSMERNMLKFLQSAVNTEFSINNKERFIAFLGQVEEECGDNEDINTSVNNTKTILNITFE